MNEDTQIVEQDIIVPKLFKKRGRKPKGGKIITETAPADTVQYIPNIILHLKCGLSSLRLRNTDNLSTTTTNTSETIFNFKHKGSELGYSDINNVVLMPDNVSQFQCQDGPLDTRNIDKQPIVSLNENNANANINPSNEYAEPDKKCPCKTINKKMRDLSYRLFSNTLLDKRSACFWCTYPFDTQVIMIPKHELNNVYHCYGCFCTPECAVSFLFKEKISMSVRFDRYYLLNFIYGKDDGYNNNIKPAPDPFYTLEKFYGTLTISEYRTALKPLRGFITVEKPMTRILPELHEDLNNESSIFERDNAIQMSNFTIRRRKFQTKNDIMSQSFQFNTVVQSAT